MRKFTAILIAVLILLCSTAMVFAASYTAADMRLSNINGKVNVYDASGKAVTAKDDLRICDGYKVTTGANGTVYIKLDKTKAIMLQQSSEIIVKKSGKKLNIVLNKGTINADVTEKLKKDESMDIHTTTMVTGIRGTGLELTAIRDIRGDMARISMLEGSTVNTLKIAERKEITVAAGKQATGVSDKRELDISTPQAPGNIDAGETNEDPVDKEFLQQDVPVTTENLTAQTVLNIKEGAMSEKVIVSMPEELKTEVENVTTAEIKEAVAEEIKAAEETDKAAETSSETQSAADTDNVFEKKDAEIKEEVLKQDGETITLDDPAPAAPSEPSGGSGGGGGSNTPVTYTITLPANLEFATIEAGGPLTVSAGGSFIFNVQPAAGFRNSKPNVRVNGVDISSNDDSDPDWGVFSYEIADIRENKTITVQPVMDTELDAATLNDMLTAGNVIIPNGVTVNAAQGDELKIPAGKTLTFASGSTLNNAGVINVEGTLTIDSGAITTSTGQSQIIVNSKNSLHIANNFVNEGTITVTANGLMDITGSFTNNGTVDVARGADFIAADFAVVSGDVIKLPVVLMYDGTEPVDDSINFGVDLEAYLTEREKPVIDYKEFASWHSDAAYTAAVPATLRKTQTFYAKYNWVKYTVRFNIGKEYSTVRDGYVSVEVEYGTKANTVLPSITKNQAAIDGGYRITRWTCTGSGYSDQYETDLSNITISEDTTLNANWSNQYLITFNMQTTDPVKVGDTNATDGTYGYAEAVYDTALSDICSKTIPIPTRDGYEFAGWFKDAACTESFLDTDTVPANDDTVVYAKWTKLVVNPVQHAADSDTLVSLSQNKDVTTVYVDMQGISGPESFEIPEGQMWIISKGSDNDYQHWYYSKLIVNGTLVVQGALYAQDGYYPIVNYGSIIYLNGSTGNANANGITNNGNIYVQDGASVTFGDDTHEVINTGNIYVESAKAIANISGMSAGTVNVITGFPEGFTVPELP